MIRELIRIIIERECLVPDRKYQYYSSCEPDEDDTDDLHYDVPIGRLGRGKKIGRGNLA